MEKELLQKALDSILHGSTQVVSSQDGSGYIQTRTERINDLRIPLVEKLAKELVNTEEFKKAILQIFTQDVVKKIQEKAISLVSFNDLDYRMQDNITNQMKDMKVEVKKYKIVAEVIDEAK